MIHNRVGAGSSKGRRHPTRVSAARAEVTAAMEVALPSGSLTLFTLVAYGQFALSSRVTD